GVGRSSRTGTKRTVAPETLGRGTRGPPQEAQRAQHLTASVLYVCFHARVNRRVRRPTPLANEIDPPCVPCRRPYLSRLLFGTFQSPSRPRDMSRLSPCANGSVLLDRPEGPVLEGFVNAATC